MNIGIAGGGIGGLTAALLLSNDGHEVTIYERSLRLGGRLAFQPHSEYRLDQGPTIVLLPDMLRSLLQEGGIEEDEWELIPCEPMYSIHYADGTTFLKHSSIDKQLEEITRVFPGEEQSFIRYMNTVRRWYEGGRPAFLEQPFLRHADLFRWPHLKLFKQMRIFSSVQSMASEFYNDPKLVDAFSLQSLYIGGAPHLSPALYSLIPFAEHEFGIWYVKGGYASLIPLIERKLRERGVTIRMGTGVDRLAIHEGRCRGVVAGGSEQSHDAVVYNGDFPGIYSLLPESCEVKPVQFKPSSGCLLVYMGVEKQFPNSHVHQFVMPNDFRRHLHQVFDQSELPDDPAIYVFNPSRADPGCAPDGHSALYALVPVPSSGSIDWTMEGSNVADRAIDILEQRGFAGLREAIRWLEVRTPADAERDGNYMGGSFGIAPSLWQLASFRPQVKPFPKIRGLYAAGASVHPGGGVPIVMQGAKLLVNTLYKEMSVCIEKQTS